MAKENLELVVCVSVLAFWRFGNSPILGKGCHMTSSKGVLDDKLLLFGLGYGRHVSICLDLMIHATFHARIPLYRFHNNHLVLRVGGKEHPPHAASAQRLS